MSIWPFHKQFSFTTKQEEYSPPNCLFDINPVTFKKYKKLSSWLQVDLASVEAPWADNKHLERFKFEWIEKNHAQSLDKINKYNRKIIIVTNVFVYITFRWRARSTFADVHKCQN